MLEQNNVKLVGVGVEEFGVKEFIDRKYLEAGKTFKVGKVLKVALPNPQNFKLPCRVNTKNCSEFISRCVH